MRAPSVRSASDIPALWSSLETTNQERKTILREVIERVIVTPQGDSERVHLEIEWVGGSKTESELIRPVARTEQLSYFPELCERVRELVGKGVPAKEIAEDLNRRGMRPANPRLLFDAQRVCKVMRKLGLVAQRASRQMEQLQRQLGESQWTLPALARELGMPEGTLFTWRQRGWVQARRQGAGRGSRWILWADQAEIARLRDRRAHGPGFYSHEEWVRRAEARMKAKKQG